ncbi:MarR family transcriptional regulator [Amycolatopsis sp. PS_44_ISF1]|uniref:MarR family winged helix-turn-helix transcriptional regulator n=1 Tax=Amycolatopsis sp. PS_44_ISF1 TaxID=2974917 RepID=UPI0028DD6671|nr:MarR family transcriptional regulator [Amycolatopsis sp. PS_44_ISF1]MDT8915211.1 MarR family transcriptional regulator [Amycolatopsis sp. PS_44_ISF1]
MRDVNHGLGYTLWQLQHRIQRMLEREMGALRVTLAQASALARLEEEPGTSSAELARHLLLSPQAVSLIIGRLEAAGHLVRAAPAGGRSRPLALTESGRRILGDAERAIQRVRAAVFGGLDAGEREVLQDLLDRSLAAAKDHG